MTTRLLIHFTLLMLWCIPPQANGVEQRSDENILKAVFIYNFAKFTRWPSETWTKNGTSLRICSIGNDELSQALVRLNGRKVRELPVTIEHREESNNLDNCHLLYLARSMQHLMLEINKSIRTKPVLTVSEITDFSKQGGMIELYRINSRIRFKINLQAAREAGLDLSSRLLKLAVDVKR
ncbi:MAG: YfiR family protein [Candidatus Thiodiazotropha sp. (ex Ctena orbiculata)]|uniref:YfiR family protein n=1 Tax=Candidatus Thiodiazotropha taylori TaxID=2792791 RepID=A0A944M6D4_9GAMM|nr:YfiR family protein [Candidatus Thiodiazotropha taylori]PUB80995.1 MAG: DUF4154 domain-containing protein [gamma proteobacterium symbiont of Ctena orbiculata]MBT2987985.1 YfiR family protein [Candidatus Thiodiazotropha taylori]MBT2997630.1 YfiR family protein [Candidatus Thiodiazotropha taylori]MBT3001949.1 YfiR family protein [Candidatus Thiodiazotropha taylori]